MSGEPSKRYIDLGDNLPDYSAWSNKPEDIQLDLYFEPGPDAASLSNRYEIDFVPIMIFVNHSCAGSNFLLADRVEEYFYIWVEKDDLMYRF
ncbi:hypothetical protein QBC38DRAFT_465155 [Podospora fimiseda]|uniref:Uncharacterized protein n=1 Tax=Podospora fimiseda TaxID=252190 RepID=A0AAN7BYI8_9PEZI|nr:hypothetical protein QBC38DRAFT_465155 [Podospora fimiseda]